MLGCGSREREVEEGWRGVIPSQIAKTQGSSGRNDRWSAAPRGGKGRPEAGRGRGASGRVERLAPRVLAPSGGLRLPFRPGGPGQGNHRITHLLKCQCGQFLGG